MEEELKQESCQGRDFSSPPSHDNWSLTQRSLYFLLERLPSIYFQVFSLYVSPKLGMRLIVPAVTQRTRSPMAHEYRPERLSPQRFAQVRGAARAPSLAIPTPAPSLAPIINLSTSASITGGGLGAGEQARPTWGCSA